MTKYTEFGDGPVVTVRVSDEDGIMDKEDLVEVNWSCRGALPIAEAEKFYGHLRKALVFARRHQRRHEKRMQGTIRDGQTEGWCEVIKNSPRRTFLAPPPKKKK